MGAALTYARRYALFTLVGIAGEDDVDALDLVTPQQEASEPGEPKGNGSLNVGQSHALPGAAGRSGAAIRSHPGQPALGPEASAELHDRLLDELHELASGDEAALWAHRSLPEKNKLTTADAGYIEEAFQTRLTAIATSTTMELEPFDSADHGLISHGPKAVRPKRPH
jgi:ERF superfamily